jgi:hypothetical protein
MGGCQGILRGQAVPLKNLLHPLHEFSAKSSPIRLFARDSPISFVKRPIKTIIRQEDPVRHLRLVFR